jgi:hypothetical protein
MAREKIEECTEMKLSAWTEVWIQCHNQNLLNYKINVSVSQGNITQRC